MRVWGGYAVCRLGGGSWVHSRVTVFPLDSSAGARASVGLAGGGRGQAGFSWLSTPNGFI